MVLFTHEFVDRWHPLHTVSPPRDIEIRNGFDAIAEQRLVNELDLLQMRVPDAHRMVESDFFGNENHKRDTRLM